MKKLILALSLVATLAFSGVALADDAPRNVKAVPGVWYTLNGHNQSISYGGTTIKGHDGNVNHKACFEPGCSDSKTVVDAFATPNPAVFTQAAATPAAATAPATTATAKSTTPAASTAKAATTTKATTTKVAKLPSTSTAP